jgi:hypothetical protein
MGEILTAITGFLGMNARTAFALFAAAVTTWLLLRYGVISNNGPELAVAYVGVLSFFVLLGTGIKGMRDRISARAKQRRDALQKKDELDAKKAAISQQQARIISQIPLLKEREQAVLSWMYHRNLRRIRANHGLAQIGKLVSMRLLMVENGVMPFDDRIFIMPKFVDEALAQFFGERNENSAPRNQPW